MSVSRTRRLSHINLESEYTIAHHQHAINELSGALSDLNSTSDSQTISAIKTILNNAYPQPVGESSTSNDELVSQLPKLEEIKQSQKAFEEFKHIMSNLATIIALAHQQKQTVIQEAIRASGTAPLQRASSFDDRLAGVFTAAASQQPTQKTTQSKPCCTIG